MRYLYTFLIMFGFWLLRSGKFALFHLTRGIQSSALVSFLSANLCMHDQGKNRLSASVRFLLYIPWLLYQVVLSALHVTFLALHLKMKDLIDPTRTTSKTKLTTDIAKGALVNFTSAYINGDQMS